jgi:hypothetical protein
VKAEMRATLPFLRNASSETFYKSVLIVLIVFLFLYRAADTLVSDHGTGDQRAYVGMAMKLEREGIREYNLYHISRIESGGMLEYVYSEQEKGELLGAFIAEGNEFFGRPLYHVPPLLSYFISFSHRIFSPDESYRVLYPAAARQMGFKDRLKVQLYSSLVPLSFGLVLIIATFCLARMLFDYWTAIVAMLLIAVSPAVILASERIWGDTLVAAMVSLTILLLLHYYRSNNLSFFIVSVVSYAFALLTKNTAILVAPTVVMAAIYFSYRKERDIKRAILRAAIMMGIFFALTFLLTFPWYYIAYKAFGTPMTDVHKEGISKIYGWYAFQEGRPWYTYLVSIPTMVPLLLLGYYRVVSVLRQRKFSKELLLVVWFLSFFISIILLTQLSEMLGPDSRYMLPAYPPLAILASSQIMRFRDWLALRFSVPIAQLAIIGSLIICVAWSYSLSNLNYAQFPQMYEHFMNIPW